MRLLTSIITLILILLLLPLTCLAWTGQVVHVADGDTITVTRNGERVRIRLYGIDTPEMNQYYGQNAKEFASAQVMGKTVTVEEIDIDRYGRVVGIVSVGDLILNRHLIEYGYAWVYDRYCKRPFCAEWKVLEVQARQAEERTLEEPQCDCPLGASAGRNEQEEGDFSGTDEDGQWPL